MYEQNQTIYEIWDGSQLNCSFRRCVDRRLYQMWEEQVNIAETLILSDEEEEPIWKFNSTGCSPPNLSIMSLILGGGGG
jgi:hypothetical protein